MPKSIFKSWTFWFGISQILSAALGMTAGAISSGEGMTLILTGMGTIGLRFKTTQPVTLP